MPEKRKKEEGEKKEGWREAETEKKKEGKSLGKR